MNLSEAKPKQLYTLNNGLVIRIFQVKANRIEPMVWACPEPPHPNIRMMVYSIRGKLLLTHYVHDESDKSYDVASEFMLLCD